MSRPKPEQIVSLIDRTIKELTELKQHIPAVLRRDEQSADPDGFPRGGDGTGSSGTVSRPTENAALSTYRLDSHDEEKARGEWVQMRDEVRRIVSGIVAHVDSLASHAHQAVSLVTLLTEQEAKMRGRQSSISDCANQYGCPDERLNEGDRGRCRACANYLRLHGRDRTRRAA